MKRSTSVVLFILVLAIGKANAQTSRFGPKVGANFSTWYNSPLGNVNWRFGFQAGVAWDNDFGNKFHFAPEIYFIQKGFVIRTPQYDRVDKVRMNYIEVPLIGKFDLENKSGKHPFFSMGATLSYYLGGNFEQTQDGVDVGNGQYGDGPDKKYDIGALAGVGMDLGNFIFEFRGQLGFTSPFYFDTGRHAALSVNFTYLFGSPEEEEEDGFEDRFE